MVIVPADHVADTPAGNPFAPDTPSLDMPVAPVVVMVMEGLIAVLRHSVGLDDGLPAVFAGVTVTVPAAFTLPQPPVKGML
jgi:hypothetical protein